MQVTPKKIVALTCLFFMAIWLVPAGAQNQSNEYQIKAVMLSKLLDFVSWNKSQDTEILFCVVGTDPFRNLLDLAFADQSRVTLRRLESNDSRLTDCNVVYISDSELKTYRELLSHLEVRQILTISDISRFASNGGMINLTFTNRRVRFRINQEAAEKVGLKLSYQLLNLADIVNTRGDAQ